MRGRHRDSVIRKGDMEGIGTDIAKLIDRRLNSELSNDDDLSSKDYEDELSQLTFELTKFIGSGIANIKRV